jgi:LuxR family maltose regulon positive regulatory protein
MIPEARACSYQLHTTRPYLTNRTYRENAEALLNTVRSHVQAIYRKVGVSSRAEAVTQARQLGLLPTP